MKQIFPKEIIENSAEVHQFRHSTRSKVIYVIILVALIGTFGALPFLRVDVYTSARGIIKPNKDRVGLNVINSGRILHSKIINNRSVYKGDTLLVIDDNGIDDRLGFLTYQLKETTLFIEDLTVLLGKGKVLKNGLVSSKYQRVYLQYTQKLRELRVRYTKVKRDFDRNKILYDKGVISKSEFENKHFEYDLAISDIDQFKKQQKTTWQADLTQYQNELKEVRSNEEQLIKTKSQFIVTAPISGTILNVSPQELGNFISTGTQLGEISPDTDLLVECYVKPSDIGLLKERNQINFQIDAYNYNQWGLATGEVIEIGNDMELMENQPVFKVRCKMHQKSLSLKNGFTASLKKGMTLNANFELTQRSLFDLLYDKMDDWLNPSRIDRRL
jgi:HlyD family secretion protein